MSTRWYPLYQRGNPQLRVFLPNFWLKLVRPSNKQPENVVQFECSMEMTKHDIRNYLQKIYNVQVADVSTRIALGRLKRDIGKGYVTKQDDIKYAYVKLPKDQKFVFPDLFAEEKNEQDELNRNIEEAKKTQHKTLALNKNRPTLPGWFSI